jgi:hypothetical protein
LALGLGNDENAGTLVASSGIGSANNSPSRVIPQRGKVSEYVPQSETNVACDVLQDDKSGS